MQSIEQALIIKKISKLNSDVYALVESLDRYLENLYPSESNHLEPVENLLSENSCLFGAYLGQELVGLGAGKLHESFAELKRFYVSELYRGKGISDCLIAAVEKWFIDRSIFVSRLETGVKQTSAIHFYEKHGYQKSKPFGTYQEDPLSIFMRKEISLLGNRPITFSSSYHVVVFKSKLEFDKHAAYTDVSKNISSIVVNQPGFLGAHSFRDTDGNGITTSYWKNERSIFDWKNVPQHQSAQKMGKEGFYESYKILKAKVVDCPDK